MLRIRVGRHLAPIPRFLWQRLLTREARATRQRVERMTANHHRVRNYAVSELRTGRPLSAARLAADLQLSLEQVEAICDELEHKLTFLYRTDRESVSWAYPVTSDVTPHYVAYESGEPIYAA